MKLRILHVGKFFPPVSGGIENFLGDLLSALTNHDVEVAALVHDSPASNRGEGGWQTAFPVRRASCYGRVLYAPVSPTFPFELNRMIREFSPDIIHLHLPNTSVFWALILSSARKIPWVVHWHADVVASKIDRRLGLAYSFYRPFEQAVLRRAAAIIATSERYLESSVSLAAWRDKCRVIPLGLDPERLEAQSPESLARAAELWAESTGFRVLAIGRLTYYKGYEYLIRAAAEVDNLNILIVGDGEQRKKMLNLINSLNVASRVRLAGFQDAEVLHALLASCDCLCLPSIERTEAFGLVLLEAMCNGKSVIASDVPGSGMGYVVEHGRSGLLVESANHSALAHALRCMDRDRELGGRMGRCGAERFAKYFHISQVAGHTKALYRDILAQVRDC